MIAVLASALLMALSRAELIARLKAPVLTQCEGLVKVYADCSEDMRREYQMPIASFASETVKTLYRGEPGGRMRRFQQAGIVIHVGDVRTNDTRVIARVSTNGTQIVSRLYLPAPGFSDLHRFRLELVKAFARSVRGEDLGDGGAVDVYRAADPRFRIEDERAELEGWLTGGEVRHGRRDAEHYLALMRKIIEPGVASRRDVLVFASRLFLYPPRYDRPFLGRLRSLSFRQAAKYAVLDPLVRAVARQKASEVVIFGGGRGEKLLAAAAAYSEFLMELSKGDLKEGEMLALLDDADVKLNVAYEEAAKRQE